MRIINVIEVFNGVVQEIKSFGVFEEQLVDDVVKEAEADFTKKAIEHGAIECEMDLYIEDGGYYGQEHAVVIAWSDIT